MVTLEQMQTGLAGYVEKELVSKVPGVRKWVLALVATPVILQSGAMIGENKEMLVKAGYMTEDGMIDIDRIHSELKEVARKTGPVTQSFPVIGTFTFTEADIDTLRTYIGG